MLPGAGRRYTHSNATSARDSVHNYYEQIVMDELLRTSARAKTDSEFFADAACVALNHLPPRYVRHDVDMTFFMSPKEYQEMLERVAEAVEEAANYVEQRGNMRHTDDN